MLAVLTLYTFLSTSKKSLIGLDSRLCFHHPRTLALVSLTHCVTNLMLCLGAIRIYQIVASGSCFFSFLMWSAVWTLSQIGKEPQHPVHFGHHHTAEMHMDDTDKNCDYTINTTCTNYKQNKHMKVCTFKTVTHRYTVHINC